MATIPVKTHFDPASMRLPGWVTGFVAAGAFVAITVAESRRPLRLRREPAARRFARNLATASLTAVVTAVVQSILLRPAVERADRDRLGLLNQIRMLFPLRIAAGILMADYTLWWWHFANHRVPFLWRFHLVHHVDRDLDVSTAARFHFGEMSMSVLLRAAQVRWLGVHPLAMSIWQTLLLTSIFFHHSNLRLRPEVERRLVAWIVTPRMHGIHHSDRFRETDSNWSSLLSVWDSLHGTMLLSVPQEEITIGVPAYRDPRDVTLGRILLMPFRRQRKDWDAAALLDDSAHAPS